MNNLWNHALCDECYEEQEPGRNPVRLKDRTQATPCCECGGETRAGIFYRAPPTLFQCQAKTGIHEREEG